MAEIILVNYKDTMTKVYVDAEDFLEMSQYRWRITPKNASGVYTAGKSPQGKSKTIYLHRLILNAQPGQYVDHIDGDNRNNTRKNLRITTNQENCQNRHGTSSNNTSGYRGVSYSKSNNKWAAYYWENYFKFNVGYFDNIEEAALAVSLARRANMPFSEADKPGAILDVTRSQKLNTDLYEPEQIAA